MKIIGLFLVFLGGVLMLAGYSGKTPSELLKLPGRKAENAG
jgi:hypothetical protein